MKKILLIAFLLGNALALNAWVFLDSVDPKGEGWLLPKMLSGKTVRVCVDVVQRADDGKSALYSGENQAAYYAMSAQIVYNAYQSWFDNLRSKIRQSERKKEFKDLLARLPKKAPVQFINISPSAKVYKSCSDYAQDEVDLRVRATLYPVKVQQPEKGFITFRLMPENTGLMGNAKDTPASSLTFALRQTGYTLGLASPAVVKAGLGSPVYAVKDAASSVMDQALTLTCDDAEGLANLADFFTAGKDSPRAQGWLSFCPQRNVAYAAGVPFKVTSEDQQAQQAYAAQDYAGPAPLAAKAAEAKEKAAQYLRVKQAQRAKQSQQLGRQVGQVFKQTQKKQH